MILSLLLLMAMMQQPEIDPSTGRYFTFKEVHGVLPPNPEPMDVPAIEQATDHLVPSDRCFDCFKKTITTCADKHRVLLTSEDGEKHCILFQRSHD